MSDRELKATITATDHASPVFAKVADGATKMGRSAEQAGKQASRGLGDMEKAGRSVGLGLAALGGTVLSVAAVLGEWSRNSQDAAAIQRQLEAAIAATGETYDTYADQIEKVGERAIQLGRDDEEASQAIAALTEITGSASAALEQMGLVFDLAAAKHMTLENAAELIGKVMEGNTTILQRYGIVVEKGASSTEALAQIQQQVAGQAEASATSYARLREEVSNLTDRIGGAVSGFAPMLTLLPGISSGLVLAGAAAGGLSKAAGGLAAAFGTQTAAAEGAAAAELELAAATEVEAGASVAAEAASAGLLATLGPIVLVAAAAGAAVLLLSDHLGSTYADAVRQATDASEELVDVLARLASGGSEFALVGAEWRAGFVAQASAAADLGGAIEALEVGIAKLREAQKQPGVDNQAQINQMGAQLEKLYVLRAQFGSTEDAAREYGETLEAIGAIAAHIGPGQDQIVAKATELYDAFTTHKIGAKQYGDSIQDLAGSMGRYDAEALKAKNSTDAVAASFAKTHTALSAFNLFQGKGDPFSLMQRSIEATADAASANGGDPFSFGAMADLADGAGTAVLGLDGTLHGLGDTTTGVFGNLKEGVTTLHDLGDATTGTLGPLEEGVTALHGLGDATAGTLGNLKEGATALHGIEEATSGLFDSAALGATALERLANGSRDAADALGGFKEIQDGIIGQQDVFNQQFSEYGSQISAIERAQEILNQRRAEGQQLQQDELDFLNEAPAALERLTGGQEDAAVSAGELAARYGENMSLGDQLNSSLGGVTGAVGGLTQAVGLLTAALTAVPMETAPSVTMLGIAEALGDVGSVQGVLNTLAGSSANPPVTAVGADAAAGAIFSVQDALNAVDGRSATAYINTVITTQYQTIGAPGGGQAVGPGGGSRDGGVLGYADGGVVAELAEVGPERLRFRNGGTAVVARRGFYDVPVGTYVTPTAGTMAGLGGGVNLTVNVGEVNGLAGVEEFASALAGAVQRRWASLGM